MDINCLKTFLEVYRTSHFGKAAESLFVTQSTVSARIRQLEDDLGTRLFKRDRNNIQLTPAGKKFLAYAENIVTIWNKAKIDITVIEEGKSPFVIGVIPGYWDIYLVKWLGKFRKKFPELFLYIETLSREQLRRNLLELTVDIGFSYDQLHIDGIISYEYQSFDLIMVTSQKNLALHRAFGTNYYYVDWGTGFAREHARHFDQFMKAELKINMSKIALDCIKSYGGTAYLPEAMVQDELINKTLYTVKDAPVFNRKSYLVYNENYLKQSFIDAILALKPSKQRRRKQG